jgi:hypothetical protein
MFELQVLPQLLYDLRVDERAAAAGLDVHQAMDWGSLVIYTCAGMRGCMVMVCW